MDRGKLDLHAVGISQGPRQFSKGDVRLGRHDLQQEDPVRGQLACRARRVPLNQRRKAPSVPNPSRQTDRRARAYPENPARSATGMARGNVVRNPNP